MSNQIRRILGTEQGSGTSTKDKLLHNSNAQDDITQHTAPTENRHPTLSSTKYNT